MAHLHSEGSLSHDSNDESDYREHEAQATNTRSKAGSSASSKKKTSVSRRASQQTDDHKDALQHDDQAAPQNARKMQNRLAQREFRARRLEHIKELEARVEFLSKPQSEQTEILVAIIHGLMDENKQLRGSLKTMANFVSSGLGGLTHAIQLPAYDNALDLVNRGDRALLLKLVQEKGGSVGTSTGSQVDHMQNHDANTPSNAQKASPSPPASAIGHADKKRKNESSHDTHIENKRSSNVRPPRTRSHNTRSRQDNANISANPQWQENTPRPTPPIVSPLLSQENKPAKQDDQSDGTDKPPSKNPEKQTTLAAPERYRGGISADNARLSDTIPCSSGGTGPMASFDIFGDRYAGQDSNFESNASSAFGPGVLGSASSAGVKREEASPVEAYRDPASAWLNAYTTLTPLGGEESFWSHFSPNMAAQGGMGYLSQLQQPQVSQHNPGQVPDQNGRSDFRSYAPHWNPAGQMLSSVSNNSFPATQASTLLPEQQLQQALHGYA